jgi:hypothetical protein
LFRWLHHGMFSHLYADLILDLTTERTAVLIRVAGYVFFGAVLVLFNVIFDYARIRIVVEDRRSAFGAIPAGARFVRRHLAGAAGLYQLNGAAFVALLAIYAVVSPGAPGTGIGMWAVLLLGQLYIVGRHYLKLVFYASQTAFFQSELAHTPYTGAPSVEWPDSPAAESITNADPVGLR